LRNHKITGVYSAATTPLNTDGSPDLGLFTEHCQRLIEEGCHGVALLGTTGEAKEDWEILAGDSRSGLKLLFADQGPGIPNLDLAMTDGWTSGNGLGMGLTGAKRLVNEFEIDTKVDGGTRVTIVRWK